MNKILKLAFTDFKIIFRDATLKAFLFLPLLLFALIIWGVPALVDKYAFLTPYLPLILGFTAVENTQAFCFISSMVLIDEKETNVAKVYGVIPLSKVEYLISRFLIPYVFTFVLNVALLMVQPFFHIGLGVNVLIAMLTALVVPVYVLGINSIVKNRMEGMVYFKAFNMMVLLPLAASFVPENFKHLFGILPTHWVFQCVENAAHGFPIGIPLAMGFFCLSSLLIVVSRLFMRKHFV